MRLSRRLLTLPPGTGPTLALLVVVLLAITASYVGQGLLVALGLAALLRGEPVS